MGVFPCARPSVEMGNLSASLVRSLQSVWDSVFRLPNSLRSFVHNESEEEEVEEGGTRAVNIAPRNFYKNQCRVLEEQLSFAEEISNQNTSQDDTGSVPSANLLCPQPALTELRRALNVGKALIEECNDEPCLKAYLRQGERTEAFAETLKEIVWCLSVVFYYDSIKGCVSENPDLMAKDQFPFVKLGAYKELHMLQKAALTDQTELLTSLNIWIQGHVCSAKECGGRPQDGGGDPPLCIAAQILRRTTSVDSAVIKDSSQVEHTSVLWNINSEILENGVFIGGGSFGSVVETKWLGDTYAKKVFQMPIPEDFRNEANALSKLSHRHMVTVLAYSMDSQTCSLLMERMPCDLRQYMTYRRTLGIDPPFSISAAIDLMLQVAETMRYVHSQKMVHRDLKAANILVEAVNDAEFRKEGFVVAKLTDFGLAKSKREVTAYSHLTKNQGSRKWMAPEVFGADGDNDEHLSVAYPFKTDVYSFGIVCFEILTGMMPFPDVRLPELYSLITDARNPLRPELPESCPESLASLIRQCWHTDPERRPRFTEICMMLRYLKALLMLTGDDQLQHWIGMPYTMAQAAHEFKQIPYSSSYGPYVYTTFDGCSWSAGGQWPKGVPIPGEMSLVEHQGAVVAIHRGCTDSIFGRTYTGSSWTQPEIIYDHETVAIASRPVVTSFKGRLFCLYSAQTFIQCMHSDGLKGRWTRGKTMHTVCTSGRPALAAFGDRLISVICGLDNGIMYWNYTRDPDGRAWSAYAAVDSALFPTSSRIGGAAQLVVINDELYCFAHRFEAPCWITYCCKMSQGDTTWSRSFSPIWTGNLPSNFTVFKNNLVCTLSLTNTKLGYGIVDTSGSQPAISITTTAVPNYYYGDRPSVCVINSKLFCVFKGGDPKKSG